MLLAYGLPIGLPVTEKLSAFLVSVFTYVPVQALNLLHLNHVMPPVSAALHGSCNAVPLEFGLQIIQTQLHMP